MLSGADATLLADFLSSDAVSVAHGLIGCRLFHVLDDRSLCGGTIVEAEAYREDDPASHSHRGPTPRSRVMFGPPGVAYVYLIYGMYDCFNVVCEPEGSGAAVLIRALEPTHGLDRMWHNRFPDQRQGASRATVTAARSLASGPGRLCGALGITRAGHNGSRIRTAGATGQPAEPGEAGEAGPGDLVLLPRVAGAPPVTVCTGPRVGIRKAADRPWRFFEEGNPFVSGRSTRE